MASSSSSPPMDVPALKTKIYEAFLPQATLDPDHVFHQDYLAALGFVPVEETQFLMRVMQLMVNDKILKFVQDASGMGWRLRTLDQARMYKSFSIDQELVYSLIDESGTEGVWSKLIKSKSGLHEVHFRHAIRFLESKHLITDMKSVEHPARKMYILSSRQPSERATGGPWYTDGELDLAFIAHMMKACEDYIRKKSFYYGASHASSAKKKEPKKGRTKPSTEEIKALREKGLGPRAKQEGKEVTSERAKRKAEYDRMLPMPAGYTGYPRCGEITVHIDNLGISSTILTAADVQQLLDIMCFDEKIEKVMNGEGDWAYRTLRKSLRDPDTGPQNLLTEAPCGRCPVFDLCEEGGPVGPSNCEYFNDWLSL